jgi:hypothetical protein
MYLILLTIHSLFRWFVLISLIYALYRAYTGWFSGKVFTKHDDTVRHTTATISHIQLLLGFGLYFVSPIVNYFFDHFKDAVHERPIRFFGMEHISMMFIAIIILSAGSSSTKRKTTDKEKFKTIAVYYSIALFIILLSIPWPFSPLAERPYWRWF